MKSTITLAMMAHNEANYLPRVEKELDGRINSVVIISDPPNDDDTILVAKETFSKYNFQLIERPWPDDEEAASTARNEILKTAMEMGDDYVLWLDPDSPLVGTIPDELTDPIYAFYTVDRQSNISWPFPHLIRKDQTQAKWVGAIHELIDVGGASVTILNTAYIDRNGSGGGVERMKRFDLPLLEKIVAKDPNDSRHLYYLAQTLRDMGELDRAIELYAKRTTMYGDPQETFYSFYMVGVLYLMQKNPGMAEGWLLKAHAFRPSRHEPVERLIEIYKSSGQYIAAMELMENRFKMPPSNDVQLVQHRPLPKIESKVPQNPILGL